MWQIMSELDKLKDDFNDIPSESTTQNIGVDPSWTDTNWNSYKVIKKITKMQWMK
jgi:hypothetical protein